MAGDRGETRARSTRGRGRAVDGRQGLGHGRPRTSMNLFSEGGPDPKGASTAEPG